MGDAITAYPLCWPLTQPRTPTRERVHGRFGSSRGLGSGTKPITIAQARDRLLEQVARFTKVGKDYRTSGLVISSNIRLRLDGLPKSGQKTPEDTGVSVYFKLDGRSRCIPCDNYIRVEDNLAAIAATIEALRTIERHGSAMFEAAFNGFTALPSPHAASQANWREVLDYFGVDIKECWKKYKLATSKHHPDKGGDPAEFCKVQEAWKQATLALS